MQHVKLVVFDLDGTILNTLADLAYSVNDALEKCGFPVHAMEAYKHFVGNGVNKLLERSLPDNRKTPDDIARLKALFLACYEVHNMDRTEPYTGVHALLQSLQSNGFLLAVASNKYQAATEKLIRRFFPDCSFAAVLGQREGVPVKPNPAIVFDILRMTGVSPEETLYIGDSGVDMATAFNSGVTSVGVTWGFRPREELEAAGACHIADSTDDIMRIININIHTQRT